MGVRQNWSSSSPGARQRPAQIALERLGAAHGQVWHYALSWHSAAGGILLLREWGVLGTERPRRRLRTCPSHEDCDRAIEHCIRRLLGRGYRLV